MTALAKVVVLGVVQGLTEFLPVSSSGHLVLVKHWLGLDAPGVTLEVALHAGTLVSILVYYARSIRQLAVEAVRGSGEGRRYAALIGVSCVPAVLVYALLNDSIEQAFADPGLAAAMLCVTGVVLLTLLFRRDDGSSAGRLAWGQALAIGAGQALALLPGISRSGMTVTAGRHLKLAPLEAARFSLLMSVPLLAAATLLKGISLGRADMGDMTVWALAVGASVSAVTGYAAIALLVRALTHHLFWVFGIYCLLVGAVTLVGGL